MGTNRAIVWKLDETPEWVQPKLEELFPGEEKVRLCFESDMTLDGHYEPEALVVTDQRVLAIGPGSAEPLREVPLRDVALSKVKWHMGNGILLITTWDHNVEMQRFSPSLADQVEEFKEELDQYLMDRLAWEAPDQHEQDLEHRDEEDSTGDASEGARRCPECGQLLPRDRDICRACVSTKRVVSRMLAYLKPYKKTIALSLVLTCIMSGVTVVVPRLGKTIIDEGVRNGNLGVLRTVAIVLGLMLLVRAGVAALRKLVVVRVAQNVIYDLRHGVYSHLQKLSMDFHDRQSTGRLIARVVSDTTRLQRFAVGQVQQFVVDVFVLVMMLGLMLSQSVTLTLMVWFPLPIFYFLIRWYRNNIHKVLRKAFRLSAGMSGHLADTIPGIAMVKAFSQENRTIDEFNRLSNGYREERIKATAFSAAFAGAFVVLTQVGTVLVYWLGGRAAVMGEFTTGSLVMFIGWLAIMYGPVRRFALLTEQFESAATSAERVFDVLDAEVVVSDKEDGEELEEIREGIRFEGVGFNYEGGPLVLRDVSFEVKAGETVGIVGPSGSGKSTLMKLLCRFYDPSKGRILVDGTDLSDIKLKSFRRQLAVVGQSPVLFRDSILENIRYGRPDANRDEVIRAARIANAHEFIMSFPEAYDTNAREQGNRFSGGERQRICIARAIVKDPELLVLDEATSSVDTKNEKLIQEALDRLCRDRTTFIIAHRLSTLRNADKIAMFEDGRLLDIAPHDELMERCTEYRELVKSQSALGEEAPLEL